MPPFNHTNAETRHVCELQLVHSKLLTARKGLDGHAIYNAVRNASELIERLLGGLAPEKRAAGVRRLREAGADAAEVVRLGILSASLLKAGGFTDAEELKAAGIDDPSQLSAAGFGTLWKKVGGRKVYIFEGHAELPEGLTIVPEQARVHACNMHMHMHAPE